MGKYTNSGDFIEAKKVASNTAYHSKNTLSINSENQILFSFNFEYNNSVGSVNIETKGDYEIAVLKIDNLSDLITLDPEICIVTLDDDQQKNKLIIEDPQSSDVLGFNVYKGNVFGEFDSIGFVDYSSGNTSFIDEFSSPVKKYSIYAISLLDKCGKESGLSDAHKTTHLVIYPGPNEKWSLIWDYYAIDGEVDYEYYRIYRGADINNLELIDSVSAYYSEGTYSYTDINAPSGSLFYQVEAAIDANCSNSLAKSNKAFYIENASSIDDDFTEDGLTIFPNPTEGVFNLSSKTLLTSPVSVEIFNVKGDLINNTVIEDYNVSGKQFDLTGVSKGVYFMKVQSKQSVSVKKFCIK